MCKILRRKKGWCKISCPQKKTLAKINRQKYLNILCVSIMIKSWNYAGGKIPARYKTGTSRRKLRAVRQPIVRYLPVYETSHWARKWRFIHPYLPARIIPTLYQYVHELNSQIFLTVYFCKRFFWDKKFCINIFCVTKFCTFISACAVSLLSKINVQIFATLTTVMQKI